MSPIALIIVHVPPYLPTLQHQNRLGTYLLYTVLCKEFDQLCKLDRNTYVLCPPNFITQVVQVATYLSISRAQLPFWEDKPAHRPCQVVPRHQNGKNAFIRICLTVKHNSGPYLLFQTRTRVLACLGAPRTDLRTNKRRTLAHCTARSAQHTTALSC